MFNDHSDDTELVQFLLTCSGMSLGDFFLARLNRNSQMRKELHDALDRSLDRIVDNLRPVHLASFLRDHRDEILRMTSAVPVVSAEPPPAPPRKADSNEHVFQRARAGG